MAPGTAPAGDGGARAPEASADAEPASSSANFRFPPGFLWGAATSAHQVEGANLLNDWWAWEQAGKVATPSGAAADHWNRYRYDFDLARSLDHNAHRFSIEWSRIETEEGRWDEAAIDHYRDVLVALHERGMEPVVTLLHYTLPRWLSEKGGWEHPGMERLYERYVVHVLEALGPHARWWITLNEPVVQVFKGWLIGQWPPGKVRAWPAALRVLRAMLRTHVRAYHAIHSLRPDACVGIAKHALALSPDDPTSWLDRWSVAVRGHPSTTCSWKRCTPARCACRGCSGRTCPSGAHWTSSASTTTRATSYGTRATTCPAWWASSRSATTASSGGSSTTWAGRCTRRGWRSSCASSRATSCRS